MFSIKKSHYYKNPFVGLFLKTNDRHTLIPKKAPATLVSGVSSLQTDAVELLINQSPLLGLFSVLNSTGCILHQEAENEEKRILKKLGYNVYVMKNSLAPGNMLLANDHACYLSPQVPKKELAAIGECLGVEPFQ